MFTPSSSKTSAEPHLLEAERFPCLVIGTSAADITIAEVVEILKLFDLSPPVPTISRTSKSVLNSKACFLIASAEAEISSIVGPLIVNPVK